jgi:hypothetical protein
MSSARAAHGEGEDVPVSTIEITPELLALAKKHAELPTYDTTESFVTQLAKDVVASESSDIGAAKVRRETCPEHGQPENCGGTWVEAPQPEPPKMPRLESRIDDCPWLSADKTGLIKAAQSDASALLEAARAEDKRRIAEDLRTLRVMVGLPDYAEPQAIAALIANGAAPGFRRSADGIGDHLTTCSKLLAADTLASWNLTVRRGMALNHWAPLELYLMGSLPESSRLIRLGARRVIP